MDFPSRWSEKGCYVMRLYCLFYIISLVASNGIVTESAKGAPPTVPDGVKTKYIIQEGTKNWKLTCSAEGDRPLLITWAKDGESITSAWPRYKQLNEGKSLQIKNVAVEDAGTYKCRAANGFGSVDVEYTVVVVGKNGQVPTPTEAHSDDDFSPPDLSDLPMSPSLDGGGRAPFWIGGEPRSTVSSFGLVRPVGGSVKLKCHATGLPKPDIIWLKDGKELDDSAIGWSRGRWALNLEDLQLEDTGNYTCRVYNIFGSLNASFIVRVQNADPSLPQFDYLHPMNKTVEEGYPVTFPCTVRSEQKPVLQWIKVIDNPSHLEFNQSVEVRGLRIAVLDKKYSSDMIDYRNNTYSRSLHIPLVSATDAGWYVCVVTSQKGHLSHRFAYLNVIGNTGRMYNSSSDQSIPLHIAVGVPVAIVLLLLVGYAVYFLQRNQQKPSRITAAAQPSSSSSSGSAGHPPPPPNCPPPSLPPSSSHKSKPTDRNGSNRAISQNCLNSSSGESASQKARQQQQPLIWSKTNGAVTPATGGTSNYEYKPSYKPYGLVDPQCAVPLTDSDSPNHIGNGDLTYQPSTTIHMDLPPYETSEFTDSGCDPEASARQHYPSVYNSR